jgi:Mrp family chromosome partitioning ATPase
MSGYYSGNGNGHGSQAPWWRSLLGRGSRHEGARPYRQIALQLIHDLAGQDEGRSVLLVSPDDSAQAGAASMELACQLAEDLNGRVLLIDASSRRREVSAMLDCRDAGGFADLLLNPRLLDSLALPTTDANVWFLPPGRQLGAPGSLTAGTIRGSLSEAESRFRFIVISGGSVLNHFTPLALAPCVGCVLLMAAPNDTRVRDLEAAREALALSRARKVGILLTTPV